MEGLLGEHGVVELKPSDVLIGSTEEERRRRTTGLVRREERGRVRGRNEVVESARPEGVPETKDITCRWSLLLLRGDMRGHLR